MAISYVNGYFQLVIDGAEVGIIQKAGGGSVKAEVAKYAQSTEYLPKNHLGNLTYEDINVQCGLSMGKVFQDWVKASLDSAHQRKGGSIQVADFDRSVKQEREFTNALITEVGIPAADAAAKDAAYLTVKWAPETIRFKKGSGEKITKPSNTKQTQFKQENFVFALDGCEPASKQTSKVEGFTFKQTVSRDNIGAMRDYEVIPGALEMPNLKFTFSESCIDEVAAWHEEFVINGINDVSKERGFVLQFMDQARKNVLLELTGTGVGIFNLSRAELTNNDSKRAECTAECYVDKIEITQWNG